jgi:hypothetical protein
MAAKKRVNKKADKDEAFVCPVCVLLGCVRDLVDTESPVFKHMNNARVEFLEGIKALIDARIQTIKKGTGSKRSGLMKIKVED